MHAHGTHVYVYACVNLTYEYLCGAQVSKFDREGITIKATATGFTLYSLVCVHPTGYLL